MVFVEDFLAIGFWRLAMGVIDKELFPILGLAVEFLTARRYDERNAAVNAIKGLVIYFWWQNSLYRHTPYIGTTCKGVVAYLRKHW